MSKEFRYYAKGAEKSFKSEIPRLRQRVEYTERTEQDQEIRQAVCANSASRFLEDRDK